jgi:uncharacterized membrane protein
MSREGRIHFEEVKKIFDGVQIIFLVSLILSVISATSMETPGSDFFKTRKYSVHCHTSDRWQRHFCQQGPGICHLPRDILPERYWIFDSATDPVIDLLPDEFFLHCAILAISLVILDAFSVLFYIRFVLLLSQNYAIIDQMKWKKLKTKEIKRIILYLRLRSLSQHWPS